MSLTTREPGKQHYTLLVSFNTGEGDTQRNICNYGMEGAILTTDHDALMDYASLLVHHFGHFRTYTIAMVTPE